MQAPGFWDDQASAAKANTEYARVKKRVEDYEFLQAEVDEFDGLIELVAEDADLAAEFEDRVADVEAGCRRSRSSGCSPASTTPATRW
jgi:hypothetical protein